MNDLVAQLVEQMTLNHWVVGSSPTGVTNNDHKSEKSLKMLDFQRFLFCPNLQKSAKYTQHHSPV